MWLFKPFLCVMGHHLRPFAHILGVMVLVGVVTVWTWPLVPIVTQLAGMIAIAFVIRRARQARSQRW